MPGGPESTPGVRVLAGLEPFLVRGLEPVSRDLETYAELLTRWQIVQNLVSRETLAQIWGRHMRDSLQLLGHIAPGERFFLDLGSGGGFPAVPLAIALKGGGAQFHLIESNKRKASFLRTVVRELGLSVKVHGRRVEEVAQEDVGEVHLVTCRATASLGVVFGLGAPFWSEKTRGLFHKGREYGGELVKARADWCFDVVELPSETDKDSRILAIRMLRVRS